jgi:hypothetical protein
MSSILKSTDLIKSIKRRGFIPESQETFTPDNFLEIATEKINIDLMSDLMDARGDFLIYSQDFQLINDVCEYQIPDRAHGSKLRDACIVDENGKVVRELTQIELDQLSDYNQGFASYSGFEPFYLQNNMLVLVNSMTSVGKYLRMHFYMRPNKLVLESRAATATTLSQTIEIDTIAPKSGTILGISTDSVVNSPAHGLTNGDTVIIAGTDSTPAIDGSMVITVIDNDNFSVPTVVTIAGTNGSWSLGAKVYTFSSTVFPKHFTSDIMYDVVNPLSPNNIKLYNLAPNSINSNLKTMSFRVIDVGTKLAKGDYITKAEETIVPNIPTEYHPLLAQMVSVACMESMADEQQKQSATNTLKEMEKKILKIVSNRVEGSPKKIKNRNGTLNQSMRYRSRG